MKRVLGSGRSLVIATQVRQRERIQPTFHSEAGLPQPHCQNRACAIRAIGYSISEQPPFGPTQLPNVGASCAELTARSKTRDVVWPCTHPVEECDQRRFAKTVRTQHERQPGLEGDIESVAGAARIERIPSDGEAFKDRNRGHLFDPRVEYELRRRRLPTAEPRSSRRHTRESLTGECRLESMSIFHTRVIERLVRLERSIGPTRVSTLTSVGKGMEDGNAPQLRELRLCHSSSRLAQPREKRYWRKPMGMERRSQPVERLLHRALGGARVGDVATHSEDVGRSLIVYA